MMAGNSSMFPHKALFENKLIQLFLANDHTNKGYLTLSEVDTVLSHLHLNTTTDKVKTSLLERIHDKDKVYFKDLKTVLIKFCNIWDIQNHDSPSLNHEEDSTSKIQAPPKLVIGSKKYGRRSLHYTCDRGFLKPLRFMPKRSREQLTRPIKVLTHRLSS
uniref:EF-hand domain-containing protein n=1 Tax=Biomphalaria glabrata TaxID=6526 RepID=A0A2C9KE46_BIOGL